MANYASNFSTYTHSVEPYRSPSVLLANALANQIAGEQSGNFLCNRSEICSREASVCMRGSGDEQLFSLLKPLNDLFLLKMLFYNSYFYRYFLFCFVAQTFSQRF